MTRVQFLNSLYSRLGALEKDQAQEWLVYYAEMLADRMEEGMSEEEAVASMEDIDVIAGRILQEAGLPPDMVSPPDVVPPPAYPSPPPMPEAGRADMPAPRHRTALNAVLWVLAGVAVVFALGRWILLPALRADSDKSWEVGVDRGEERVTEYPRPDASGTEDSPEPDRHGNGSAGTGYAVTRQEGPESGWYQVEGGHLREIHVQWPEGSVAVIAVDREEVSFEETSCDGDALADGERMTYLIRDGVLTIKSADSRTGREKNLCLMLPTWLIEKLEIETVSAGVQITGLDAQDLEVETASGSVELEEISAADLEISTVSGSVSGVVEFLTQGEIDTESGQVRLRVDSADEISVETSSGETVLEMLDASVSRVALESVSGQITLALPEDAGFALRYETVSGQLHSGLEGLSQRAGRYYFGDESAHVDVETSSGDLYLEAYW